MRNYGLLITMAGMLASIAVADYRSRRQERVSGLVWGLKGLAMGVTLIGGFIHFLHD